MSLVFLLCLKLKTQTLCGYRMYPHLFLSFIILINMTTRMMDCVKSPCRSARVAPALVIITMIVQLCSFRLRLRRIISISLCEGDGRGIDVY
jgi:hypothetical protein